MNLKNTFVFFAGLLFLSGCSVVDIIESPTKITALRTNLLDEPNNIGKSPSFSWQMSSTDSGLTQKSYSIRVYEGKGCSDDSLVWDSGEVSSGISVAIPYKGKPLRSARHYTWKVVVRDNKDNVNESECATFSTGFVKPDFWDGSVWITPKTDMNGMDTAAYHKVIRNEKQVKEAWWTITSLGVFEAYVNGETVSSKSSTGELKYDILKPGKTHVLKCRHALTYDITHLIDTAKDANNIYAAFVSQGWWRDEVVSSIGKESALRAQLILRYEDGTENRFGTDTSWVSAYAGPIVYASIYDGEKYDSRISCEWMKKENAPPNWTASKVNTQFKGEIRNFIGTTIRAREDLTLSPASINILKGVSGNTKDAFGKANVVRTYKAGDLISLEPGEEMIVDFAQNAAAVENIVLEAIAGSIITIRHAEVLNDKNGLKSRGNDGAEGTLYLSNLGSAKATTTYITKDGLQTYRPSFTFYGYRYISITTTEPVKIHSISSVPVSSISDKSLETGFIETDIKDINRLIQNVRWGHLSNYISVPTDCPQRSERAGWAADTHVFAKTACYSANVYAFLLKWMDDVVDTQHTNGSFSTVAPYVKKYDSAERLGWADAGIIVPYVVWKHFGDTSIIANNWDAMEKYLALITETKFTSPKALGFQFNDWLSYEKLETFYSYNSPSYPAESSILEYVQNSKQRRVKEDARTYWRYLGACYWLSDARMMAEMAKEIGRDGEKYEKIAREALAYIRQNFLAKNGMLIPLFNGMQTPCLFAINLGIIENKEALKKTTDALIKSIADNGGCLKTGFLGTSILMDTITEKMEKPKEAYSLLFQRKNPSWLYSVDQGATTIWERWDSYRKDKGFGNAIMNSFNHYAYGCVVSWMYRTMAGIKEDERNPGFRHFILSPIPDKRIGKVDCVYNSPYGPISSSWKYDSEGKWNWRFTIPANTTATVKVPGGNTKEYNSGSYEITLEK